MRILGIESSCDETAVAIYDSAAGLVIFTVLKKGDRSLILIK